MYIYVYKYVYGDDASVPDAGDALTRELSTLLTTPSELHQMFCEIYIYMYVYIYINLYVYIYIYIYIYVCVCVCVCIDR